MNEFDLIEAIRKGRPALPPEVRAGIGEDTAVLSCGKKELLVTCEALVEDVHFQRRWGSWEDWGKKAAGSALSDIAAMGGTPRFAFIDLHLPKNFADKNVADFYKGLDFLFIPLKMAIAGGNLARSPCGFSASLTLFGERPAGAQMLRTNARPGDLLFLAGNVGWAALGLKLLQKKKLAAEGGERGGPRRLCRRGGRREPLKIDPLRFLQAFRHPRPLLATGRWLLQNKIAHACIDVSDGLCQDATHLARASKVRIQIEAPSLPMDPFFVETARRLKMDPLLAVLTGGEDYALTFTADAAHRQTLTAARKAVWIGKVSKGPPGVIVVDSKNRRVRIPSPGFSHF